MDSIKVKAGSKRISVNATPDLSKYYSDLSKKWAVSDVIVDGQDYSSKYYANVSKHSAEEAIQSIETVKNYTLQEFANDAQEYIEAAKTQAENAEESAAQAEITVNDGVETINAIIRSTPEKFAGFGLFDTKLTDHLLEWQDAIGWALQGSLVTMTYPDAVAKVQELYTNGEETEYRGIACRRSTDGRYIADIVQKEAIDELFNSSGVAEFYILDAAGEQFYLPRSKWFQQMTLDTNLVNNYNEPGLPNITGSTGATMFGDGGTSGEGATRVHSSGNASFGGGASLPRKYISFNASMSNPIYGRSDTVQPPSSNKLLYYKVGNTVVNESLIEAAQVLPQLQSKADTALSNTTPSQSFKSMSMGWGMPDYSSQIQVSLPYTAATNGILFMTLFRSGDKWGTVNVNGKWIFSAGGNSGADNIPVQILLNKGDICSVSTVDCNGVSFVPLKGEA